MEIEPGAGWADVVDKILRTGKNNPDSGKILSKALRDGDKQRKKQDADDEEEVDEHRSESGSDEDATNKKKHPCDTLRLKPHAQKDALLENELKSDATRGVVHLFNAVKAVNPKSDKKKKKRKTKKKNNPRKRFRS